MKKVVIITGVSSGFGKATALHLAAMGHIVYGSSRKPDLLLPGVHTIRADVRNDESVQTFVNLVFAKEGKIDILINNAGIGIAGSVEDCSMDDIQLQIDTNFFGAVRMCKAVLPLMRYQKSGLIINISSLAGIIHLPFQAFYSAGKCAIDGFSNALRFEVKAWNIKVVTVNPGDFLTGFTEKRIFSEKALSPDSAYLNQMCQTFDVYENGELNGSKPELLAKLIARIIASRRPRYTYYVGKREQTITVFLKKIMPPRLYNAALASYCKIEKRPQKHAALELLNKRRRIIELRKTERKLLQDTKQT